MRQYIPKKNKGYGIQIYKLCNSTGYIRHECLPTAHSTIVYSNQCYSDRSDKATRTGSQRVQQELFCFPWLVCWSNNEKNCCGTVSQMGSDRPHDIRSKKINWKGETLNWGTGVTLHQYTGWTQETLMNVHDAPTEGNLCDEHRLIHKTFFYTRSYILQPLRSSHYSHKCKDGGNCILFNFIFGRRGGGGGEGEREQHTIIPRKPYTVLSEWSNHLQNVSASICITWTSHSLLNRTPCWLNSCKVKNHK